MRNNRVINFKVKTLSEAFFFFFFFFFFKCTWCWMFKFEYQPLCSFKKRSLAMKFLL